MQYKNILKSILAVFAGFLTVVILSVGTDAVVERLGIFPAQTNPELYKTWMLVVALLYRSMYTIAGGYITAKFAPSNPMRHVFALGILGLIGGGVGMIAGWNLSAHWYPIAIFVTAFPLTYWGGKLKK